MEALFAFLMALLFTLIFTLGFQRRGPWSSVVVFFLVVFLAAWAGSLWISHAGPAFVGIFWVPIVAVAFIFAVLLSTLLPRRPPTQSVETISQVKQEERTRERVYDAFFWMLVIGLALLILLGYAFQHTTALGPPPVKRLKGQRMANRDIITIGASAGGVEALMALARTLPGDLPASVFVVQHVAPEQPSAMAELLSRSGPLAVEVTQDRMEFRPSRIYVAAPDRHLMIDRSYAYLTRGPRENLVRPAVDPLFRSAAVVHGPHVIGVILSGSLDDGTSGLGAIKRCGGVAVVQDPEDARFPDMPQSAVEHVEVDYTVPLSQMGDLLTQLAAGAPGTPTPPSSELLMEVEISRAGGGSAGLLDEIGDLAALTCEACRGPLWEIRNEKIVRFRCREGHSYTAKTLLSEQRDGIEQSLWAAVQTMDERVRVLERLVAYDEERGRKGGLASFRARAQETRGYADHLRKFLLALNQP